MKSRSKSKAPFRVIRSQNSVCGDLVAIVDADGKTVLDNEPYYPRALDPDDAQVFAAGPSAIEILDAWREAELSKDPKKIDAVRTVRDGFLEALDARRQAEKNINLPTVPDSFRTGM